MSNATRQRKPRASKAITDRENTQTVAPYNGGPLKEVEHYHLQKLIYIYYNWNKLGDKVGKAYVDGELIDNESFKTIVEKLIIECRTSKHKFPYCDRDVTYEQNKTLKSGRYLSKNFGIINMARPVRHTICEGLYQDLDVVNCHLHIYRYLCESNELQCDYIDEYIDNRDARMEECVELNSGSSKDHAKKWFLQTLNGGGSISDKIKELTSFMQGYRRELKGYLHKELSKIVDKENPEFRKYLIQRDGANVDNLDCKIISKKLEDLENRMRHYICEWIKSKDYDFSSHCYDGGMSYLPNNPASIKTMLKIDKNNPENNPCSRYVLQHTGIRCPLKWKDFDEMIPIPQEELDKITIDDYYNIKNSVGQHYEAVKTRFERNNFFINNDVKYIFEYEPENITIEYSETAFISKYKDLSYEEEDEEGKIKQHPFIYKWITDPKKRRYDKIVWTPESIKQKANFEKEVYNLWKGFKCEHIKPNGEDYSEGVETILNHFRYLVNYNEEHYQYFLKWNARLYQYPARKTEVCIGLKSIKQGAGKTTMFDLHTAVMGKQYTAKLENPERDMFGEFNELMYRKIFILLEECDNTTMTRFQKRFLDAVTCKVDNINIKNSKKKEEDSYINYMAAWNTNGPKVGKEDRRAWVNEVLQDVPSEDYFIKLFSAINNPQVQRAFYDYLMNVDLEGFHPSRNRPTTELRATMELESKDKIYFWIKDLTVDWYNYYNNEKLPMPNYNYLNNPALEHGRFFSDTRKDVEHKGWITSEYFQHFKNWIKANGYNYHVDVSTFSKRIKSLKNEGISTYTSGGISKIKFHIMKSKDWCIKEKLITQEELDSSDDVQNATDEEDDTSNKVSLNNRGFDFDPFSNTDDSDW